MQVIIRKGKSTIPVVSWFHGVTYGHGWEQIQETKHFSGEKVCYKLCFIHGECREMGRKTRKVWGDAKLLSLNFYVLLTFSSQLTVFSKLCVMNTLLHFLSCRSCRSLRNVSVGGPHVPFQGLIKRSYHDWLNVMTSSEGPLFSIASGSPKSKSTTGHKYLRYQEYNDLVDVQ